VIEMQRYMDFCVLAMELKFGLRFSCLIIESDYEIILLNLRHDYAGAT
jgi:hypothetical protein